MTVIAEGITEYHQLLAVLQTYQPDVTGLPLLAPVAIKSLGKATLGAALGALGLKIVVEVDQEQLAKIKPRLTARKNMNGRLNGRTSSRVLRGNPDLARLRQQRWVAATTPLQRRKWGMRGAMARWGGRDHRGG